MGTYSLYRSLPIISRFLFVCLSVHRNKKKKDVEDDEKALYKGGQAGGGMWRGGGKPNPVTPITDTGKHKLDYM